MTIILSGVRLAVVSLFLSAGTALAAPVAIVNGGFELPTLADGQTTNGDIPGWTSLACSNECAGVFNPELGHPGFPSGSVPEGNNALYMIQHITQTLTTPIQGGLTYTLSLMVGNPSDRPDNLAFGFSLDALGGGNLVSYSAPLSTLSGSNGSFVPLSIQFAVPIGYADIGKLLQVNLYGPVESGPGLQYVAYDEVQLAAVPEPASALLLAGGIALLLTSRRWSDNQA